MLRGSCDFARREEYVAFLRKVLDQLNAGRQDKLAQELDVLRTLPARRLQDYTRLQVRVSQFSTVRVSGNTYSVHSRLNGEMVQIRLHADHLDVYYAQRHLECIPRLRGKGGHRIQYRHIIDQLVRKPGAFAHYRYRDDLFPTTRFRVAYDTLCRFHSESKASREYLLILELAAHQSETQVDAILRRLIDAQQVISADRVKQLLSTVTEDPGPVATVHVPAVDLRLYDSLLSCSMQAVTP